MGNLFTRIKWKVPGWNLLFRRELKKNEKVNYVNPHVEWKEELQYLAEGILIVGLLSYFFYRSYIAFIILSPIIWFYRKEKWKRSCKRRKIILEQQFKEALMSVQTNLQSGYSVENAFGESYQYIVEIFGVKSDMAKELMWIKKGLSNGDTLEHLLMDFGTRCPESAIEEFANIYSVACKTGGGWTEVIIKIVSGINQRMETKQEIEALIHGKKVESRIMSMVPFFILFYMDVTSKGYFDVLYHNLAGILIMSVCLGIYIFAFLLSEKITEL